MHVAVFNARAAARNSCIRAYVLRPKSGEGYAKNSVDIIIKNIKTRKFLKDIKLNVAVSGFDNKIYQKWGL